MVRSVTRRFFLACSMLALASLDSWAMLTLRSTFPLTGIAKDVEVRDRIAYVSTDSGLAAVDVSDPAAPVLKSFIRLPGRGNELSISGNRAFVTDGKEAAAQMIDISNHQDLHIVASMGDSCGYVWGIDSKGPDNSGKSLVVIASLSGLTMLELNGEGYVTPKSRFNPYYGLPSPIDSLIGCDSCTGSKRWIKTDDVTLDSTFAYTLYYDYQTSDESVQHLRLKKVNLADPSNPQCVDSLDLHRYGCALDVADGYACVVYTGNAELDFSPGMDIIDVKSSPMVVKSTVGLPGPGEDVVVIGTRAYVACARNGMAVLDISDKAHPALIDSFSFSVYSFPITAYGITVSDSNIYVAVGERGLHIIRNTASVQCAASTRKRETSISMTALPGGRMHLRFPGDFTGNVSISVYAANGEKVFGHPSFPVRNAAVMFACIDRRKRPLKPGVYMVRVKTGDGTPVLEKTYVWVR